LDAKKSKLSVRGAGNWWLSVLGSLYHAGIGNNIHTGCEARFLVGETLTSSSSLLSPYIFIAAALVPSAFALLAVRYGFCADGK